MKYLNVTRKSDRKQAVLEIMARRSQPGKIGSWHRTGDLASRLGHGFALRTCNRPVGAGLTASQPVQMVRQGECAMPRGALGPWPGTL